MSITELLIAANRCKPTLAALSDSEKRRLLHRMADRLISYTDEILSANALDCENAKKKLSKVMLDRLTLTPSRIADMAEGIRSVAELPDPVGCVIEDRTLQNGLKLEKRSVPLGVVAIIYESRPNVTSDAAALCLKSGNVCILRCGSDAIRSSTAIVDALREGILESGLPADCLCLIRDTDRRCADELMGAVGLVDLLIPRGGASLIRHCVETAKVPTIQTGTGICHVYVDRAADADQALEIIENAKASRPSVCNAAEVCLVHREIAPSFLPRLKERLQEDRARRGLSPVELRTDPAAYAIIGGVPAGDGDFDREFLDYILAVRVVDSLEEAIAHIAAHSTGHSEAILTTNPDAAEAFAGAVDSAAVYVNASTRFTDGGQFGLGCEMGISTQKLHARGPMGLCELTSYKYIIRGNGQIRK